MKVRLLLALTGLLLLESSLLAGEIPEISFKGLSISSFDPGRHQPLLWQSSPLTGSDGYALPAVTLAQTTLLAYPEAFGLFGATPLDYLPTTFVSPYSPRQTSESAPPAGHRNLPDFLSSFNHAYGEVGFFYGHGTGKSDLEAYSGYVLSGIENGNTQITVGAAYSKTSAREPR